MLHKKEKPVETDIQAVEWFNGLSHVFALTDHAKTEAANSPDPVKRDDHLRDYMG